MYCQSTESKIAANASQHLQQVQIRPAVRIANNLYVNINSAFTSQNAMQEDLLPQAVTPTILSRFRKAHSQTAHLIVQLFHSRNKRSCRLSVQPISPHIHDVNTSGRLIQFSSRRIRNIQRARAITTPDKYDILTLRAF